MTTQTHECLDMNLFLVGIAFQRFSILFKACAWQVRHNCLQLRERLGGNGLTVLSLLEVMMMRRSCSILA